MELDLHSGSPLWLDPAVRCSEAQHPSLLHDERCDIAIVGCGVTGALLAHRLTEANANVLMIDKRAPACGSTAASTALLQYDLDVPLHRLRQMIRPADAERAFLLGAVAIEKWRETCQSLDCAFQNRPSLYVCRESTRLPDFSQEFLARRSIGLPVEFIQRTDLMSRWGIDGHAAILSHAAGQFDPVRVTQSLLRSSCARGARIRFGNVVSHEHSVGDRTTLVTASGAIVDSNFVVYATGYEAATLLPTPCVSLKSTFAIATHTVGDSKNMYPDRAMFWEYDDPYLYARWAGDRLLIGGEDVSFVDAAARDALINAKAEALTRKYQAIVPGMAISVSHKWAGTFASTCDGLGIIGPIDDSHRILAALGFGGNGITLAMTAADVLCAVMLRRPCPDLHLFSLDRFMRPAPDGKHTNPQSSTVASLQI